MVTMLLAAVVVTVALQQPWMGLWLAPDSEANGLRIVGVASDGPAAALPPGGLVTHLGNGGGQTMRLHPTDMLEDPDSVDSYADMDAFMARQDIIAGMLRGGPVHLTLADGSAFSLLPRPSRPLSSLPVVFWVQIFIGSVGFVSAVWTLSLRPGLAAVRVWSAGGLALLLSTFGSAIFLSRELALDAATMDALSRVNIVGSFGFAATLLVLFLSYPKPLLSRRAITLVILAVPAWLVLEYFRIGLPGPGVGRYLPIAVCGIGAAIAAMVQYRVAKGQPLKRLAIGWFGLPLAVMSGLFVIFFALPSLAGEAPELPQWTSYALALVVHASFILGVLRYRLFDLEPWAFRLLFYVGGAAIFIGLDLALVSALALGLVPAFGLALAAVLLIYLPLREMLMRRFLPAEGGRQQLFQNVVDVAMTTPGAERDARWGSLMRRAFEPLSLDATTEGQVPAIIEDGVALTIPGAGVVTPLRLGYAQAGRRLFRRRDLDLAGELCAMLVHSIRSRDAYERGIAEERSRMARDMHDNIGATLLSALHGQARERKDALIREALSDLRSIINNVSGTMRTFGDSMADLRLETGERLSAAGVDLEWTLEGDTETGLSPMSDHTIRSVVREGVSNAIRHAEATEVHVTIGMEGEQLAITICDNGQGFAARTTRQQGNGLAGLQARLEALKGSFSIAEATSGVTLRATFANGLGLSG